MKVRRKETKPGSFSPGAIISLDTETTGLDTWGKRRIVSAYQTTEVVDQVFMVTMSDHNGNTWACDWPVCPFTRDVQPCVDDLDYIHLVLSGKKRQVSFFHSKYDVHMLSNTDKDIAAILKELALDHRIRDVMFMARVCFTLELAYGLKPLSKKYLAITDEDEKELGEAVKKARLKVNSYNKKVQKERDSRVNDDTVITDNVELRYMVKNEGKGESVGKADYWLPKYFDQDCLLCEKYGRLDVYRTIGLDFFYTDIMENDHLLMDKYHEEMFNIWPIVNCMETRGMRVFPEILNEESVKCKIDLEKHLTVMNQMIKDQNLKPYPIEKTTPPPTSTTKRIRKVWKEPEFNPSSPIQLMRVLYLSREEGGLGIQTDRRNRKTGNVTTDKDTLRELMHEPFVRELVQYRAAAHTNSLFFEAVQDLMKYDVNTDMWYIHPSLNQCGTKAGRFSCNNPNIQQMTAGDKKSLSGGIYSSQKVFGPRPGYVWLGFDYSQQEARLFAYLSNATVMLDAMAKGEDVFKAMANKAWGGKNNIESVKAVTQALDLFKEPSSSIVREVQKKYGWKEGADPRKITDTWLSDFNYDIVKAEACMLPGNTPKEPIKEASRQRCKHITYAKIFGGGPGSFSHLLYCTLDQAKDFNTVYDREIPQLKQYIKKMELEAKQNGFIVNLYGRKLRVERDFAYRAVSYMIQGTAADMMKCALTRVHAFNESIIADAHLIMTIHDELKIEIKESHLTTGYMRAIKHVMEDTQGKVGIFIPAECAICRERWSVNEEKIKL